MQITFGSSEAAELQIKNFELESKVADLQNFITYDEKKGSSYARELPLVWWDLACYRLFRIPGTQFADIRF